MNMRTLCDLKESETGTVAALTCKGAAARRFLDLGLTRGARVTAFYKSPSGNPAAFLIRGAVIALRLSDCKTVVIEE